MIEAPAPPEKVGAGALGGPRPPAARHPCSQAWPQGLRSPGRLALGLRPPLWHPPVSPRRLRRLGHCFQFRVRNGMGAFAAAAAGPVVLPSASAGHRAFALRVEPPSVSQSPSDANHWPLRSGAAAHCVCLLGGLWQAQTPRRSRVWHPPEEGRQGCTLTACRRGLRTAFDWWPIRPEHPKWASLK